MNQFQLKNIIAQGEGYYLEFKERFNSSIAQEIVAFANASGGKILLGVADDGSVPGISVTNDLKSKIQDIANNCDKPVDIRLASFDNVLIIHVPESNNKPHRCSDGFFLRQSANSQKLSTDEIIAFVQKEGKVRFDTQVRTDVSFEEAFDKASYQQFLREANLSEHHLSPSQLLHNLGVVHKTDNETHFTNAGLLFFTQQVTPYLSQAVITCVSYKGTEKVNILDRKDQTADLITNIKETMLFLRRHLNEGAIIEGIKRKDELEIPEVALREAIVNAVTHRDYFEKGANVMVEVFKDRVEISNPGGLPSGLSPKEFGKKGLRRNPLVAELLYRTNYIEKLGTGIRRIQKAVHSAHLPSPEFAYDSFFSITFRRAIGKLVKEQGSPKSSQKGSPKSSQKILAMMQANSEITIREIAAEIGISDRAVKKQIAKLKKQGLVQRKGSARGGYWKVKR